MVVSTPATLPGPVSAVHAGASRATLLGVTACVDRRPKKWINAPTPASITTTATTAAVMRTARCPCVRARSPTEAMGPGRVPGR